MPISPLATRPPSLNLIDEFSNMLVNEQKFHAEMSYVDDYRQFSYDMRSRLLGWIVEVLSYVDASEQTLFLAAAIFDRFFRLGGCHKALWALLAGTSIFIASKYYQISAVRVRLITEALHNTYTRQDVYDMEMAVLGRLDFNISLVTAWDFAVFFLSRLPSLSQDGETVIRSMTSYLLELALVDRMHFDMRPSSLAASCIALAVHHHLYTIGADAPLRDQAVTDLERAVSARHCFLVDGMRSLYRLHDGRSPADPVPKKYASDAYHNVSKAQLRCPTRY
ncbi:hypothetical protein PBRA_005641 [Plasmodiophora brassicae]|nr:hypothetical protein PBRA_005641 [Plasmodiophora brassicae]